MSDLNTHDSGLPKCGERKRNQGRQKIKQNEKQHKTGTRGGQKRKVRKWEAERRRMTYGRPELEEWGVTERGMRDLVEHLMSC